MLHLFVSNAGVRPQPRRPAFVSVIVHAAIIGMAYSPAKVAHFTTDPRAHFEDVRYMTLSAGGNFTDLARNTPRKPRGTSPVMRASSVPVAPQFDRFDFTLALNVVPDEPPLPDLVLPDLTDTLGGPGIEKSPFRTAARHPAGLHFEDGAGWDSVTYIAADVETAAVPAAANPKPKYPWILLNRNVEATFTVYFVVDTSGRVDTTSVQVPVTVEPGFLQAVRNVLVLWRFVPAEVHGRRVRQLMEQTFKFQIVSGMYSALPGETNAARVARDRTFAPPLDATVATLPGST